MALASVEKKKKKKNKCYFKEAERALVYRM